MQFSFLDAKRLSVSFRNYQPKSVSLVCKSGTDRGQTAVTYTTGIYCVLESQQKKKSAIAYKI